MALLFCAWPIPAQTAASGTHVRVWEMMSTDSPILTTGHLASLTTDTLAIIPDRTTQQLTIARTNIRRLDVSLGQHTGPRGVSALTGALAGGFGAGMLAVMAGNAAHRNAARAGFFGFGIGLIVGAGVGAMHPGEAWQTVNVTQTPAQTPTPSPPAVVPRQ